MARRQSRDPHKEAIWRERVDRQSRSGLSVRAFCRRENLTETAFYFWRRTIARRDRERTSPPSPLSSADFPQTPRAEFVPVVVIEESSPSPADIETPTQKGSGLTEESLGLDVCFELRGGRTLRVPVAIGMAPLAELALALESPALAAEDC